MSGASEKHVAFEVPSGLPDIVSLGIQLWGDPTKRTPGKVEFGTHGSKCVQPAPANRWFDHETDTGGGYLDLYKLKYGKLPDLPGFPIPPGMAEELGNPVAWWDYHDAGGQTIARVVRFHPPGQDKTYRQCRPDGATWRWKMQGLQIPPYHLPELLHAPDGSTVCITEGEKHADQIRAWGQLATTNAGGAKKFRPGHAAVLARFDCVILPDNDPAGREHADVVASALRAAGCTSIRVLDLPNLPPKGDVINWVSAGGTAAEFAEMVAAAPSIPTTALEDRPDPASPEEHVGPAKELPPEFDDPGHGKQDEPSTEDPPLAPQSKRRRVRGEIDNDTPPDGPTIRVVAGKLHITTTTAEDALIASGLPIYQRGDGLVQPVIREVPASHGRITLAAGLGEMNTCSLVDVMCATAEYERYDARSKDWVRINPPAQIAQTLLSRQGKWRFPVVAGIITTPTLRPDGSLLTAPGYDAATRLYHGADPSLRLHPDVAAPTRDLAERALKVLQTLLREFSFVSAIAKAVALSGIITPVVRGAMSVAPLHAVNAHTAGSGKSFLVDLISLISTGRICPVASAAPDEAETEKRIAGLLLAGYPIVSIDNCNGELGGDLLCQAIERPLIRIRRLGGSDIFEIESTVTLFATGNNLRVRGDMVRRALMALLDPKMERPELRKFQYDPVAAILADRGRYVSACLIIVRAYILAGSPGKLDPIASFRGWSDLVRSALVWLGCADPVSSMETAREDDPELSELREMISVWREAFGSTATTCKAAIAAMTEKVAEPDKRGDVSQYAPLTKIRYPDLQPMFLQVAGVRGVVDAKKLGTWLKNREGKIVGNDRFERDGTSDGAARWRLRS